MPTEYVCMDYDILIVDDEADIRMLISGILEDEGYTSREAYDADSALAAIEFRRPSLVILDIWLKDSRLDGLQVLKEVKHDYPHIPILMISGHGTIGTAVLAIQMGAYDFIEKPFKTDRLLLLVQRAIETAHLKNENTELKLQSGLQSDLIGVSEATKQLRQSIDRVAPTGSRVLISGPAGSGKEVVARLIHKNSRRSNGPFIVVHCASIQPDRIEAELFGTSYMFRGPAKIGILEEAHGGTLLFDEVADIPLAAQGKLVRALQEQTFERFSNTGRRVKVLVDVRIIAATNHNLYTEIQSGRLREDLFYRLNVVPIKVPSLQERRDDIPILAEYFMQTASNTTGLPLRSISQDAILALQSYEWPGNVRQLRNIIDWILVMAPGGAHEAISADMLPQEVSTTIPRFHWEKAGVLMTLPLRAAREIFEREYLFSQISRFGGNVSRTAVFVGMERSALHRKLKALGLIGDKFRL